MLEPQPRPQHHEKLRIFSSPLVRRTDTGDSIDSIHHAHAGRAASDTRSDLKHDHDPAVDLPRFKRVRPPLPPQK